MTEYVFHVHLAEAPCNPMCPGHPKTLRPLSDWTVRRDEWIKSAGSAQLMSVIAAVAAEGATDDPGDAEERRQAVLWLATRGKAGYEWGRAAEAARTASAEHATVAREALAMLTALLASHRRYLRNRIRELDNLSRPVAEGHWRWADVKSGGYGLKSEEEKAVDRARAAANAASARHDLEVLSLLEGEV